MSTFRHTLPKTLLSLAIVSTSPTLLFAETTDQTQEIEALWKTVEGLEQKIAESSEWKSPRTFAHLAGYADVNYINIDTDNGAKSDFTTGVFAPIFHYQYQDKVMLETELAFTVNADGETEVEMEYFTIDYFANDYMAIVMGKFLSPLGQFRQNFHPSWINKLPSAPQGFGHGGAAPVADVGLQTRGGFKIGSAVSANYAAYLGNGVAAEMNGDGDEIEEAHSPGFNVDGDNGKNYGGRFGLFIPGAKLDFGLSWATGKAAEFEESDPVNGTPATFENKRDWDFVGADFVWRMGGLDIRGEYVKQSYGARPDGSSGKADFDATYLQAAYRFPSTKWEVVIRTSTYNNPENTFDRTTAGVNYLLANNIITKLAYESNDRKFDSAAAEDKILVQLAYGF